MRLTAFEVGVLLVIGWAAIHAFQIVRQVDRLALTFRDNPEQYLQIPGQLQPALEELQALLLQFAAHYGRADRERFQRKAKALKDWIAGRKPVATQAKVIVVRPVSMTIDVGTSLKAKSSASTISI